MRAAVAAVRRARPSAVVVAVPVGSPAACTAIAGDVDDVVCLWCPERFSAVGRGYRDFAATTDDQVRAALGVEAG
jgi:predicted phosphoribosyltransferase